MEQSLPVGICGICGGMGSVVVPVAYEDENGIVQHDEKVQICHGCNGTGWTDERERRAWEEDEKDMARIKREWDAFDRDPPGS